jgi:hypothetical protein
VLPTGRLVNRPSTGPGARPECIDRLRRARYSCRNPLLEQNSIGRGRFLLTTQTRAPERAEPAAGAIAPTASRRRYGWPLAITALVLASAVAGPSALRNVVTGGVPTDVAVDTGVVYALVAPLVTVWDTLSLLTVGQHYAVLVTLVLVYGFWRVVRRRRRRGALARVGVELGVALLSFAGLLAFYAYGVLGPRPMAAIAVADPDVVVVDFHSHTEHSHDGRPGLGAEDRRAWYDGAGFDAGYIADHRTYDGWLEGAPNNPPRAGDGTVLLPGLEIRYANKYASVLGDPSRYARAMDGNNLIPEVVRDLVAEAGRRPTFVLTIPERLDAVPRSTTDSIGYVAVEVSDASPKGLRQSHRDRELLLRMTDSLRLAPVAATNHHGWGRTAAAWTLMRIPGWRRMTPEQLDNAIQRKLHVERQDATTVVERRMPWSGEDPASLLMTAPAITWAMFGGMGAAERISWLAWTWLLALVVVPAVKRQRALANA